jgi:hypothetical protein
MSPAEIPLARKRPSRRFRPKHWWFLAALGLLLSSPFLLAAWVSWDRKHSIRILETRVGSLDPATFTRPSIPTATNGAQAFLAAGAALVLSDAQKELLTKASKAPEPAEALKPEDAAVMLLGNNRAFELAREALDRPDDDWDVDFRFGASAPLPNYLPQLQLARLLLLGGDLLLRGGDRQGAIELAVLLARQVDSLYSGGPLIQALIGRASESLLHRLLHQLLTEPELSRPELEALARALPKKELRAVWLETVRREASFSARDPRQMLAEMEATEEPTAEEPEAPSEEREHDAGDQAGTWAKGGFGVVMVEFMTGGSLKWWAKASAQWEASPADLQRELANPEGKLKGPLGKIRNLLTPDFADALARLRQTAAARELLTTALVLREKQLEGDLGCAAAWQALAPRHPSYLRLEPQPDGRCRLENLEIAELRRVFPPLPLASQPTAEIVLPATTH